MKMQEPLQKPAFSKQALLHCAGIVGAGLLYSLGINLFVAARVGDEPLETVIKGIIPFILIMLLDLLLITMIPDISMTLVNLMRA